MSTLQIKLSISTVEASTDDTPRSYRRYAGAVRAGIKEAYPHADITVELVPDIVPVPCRVSDDPTGEIAEDVTEIANRVWHEASF